jgi:hypothetical protein
MWIFCAPVSIILYARIPTQIKASLALKVLTQDRSHRYELIEDTIDRTFNRALSILYEFYVKCNLLRSFRENSEKFSWDLNSTQKHFSESFPKKKVIPNGMIIYKEPKHHHPVLT